jgi:hypothetical protein
MEESRKRQRECAHTTARLGFRFENLDLQTSLR